METITQTTLGIFFFLHVLHPAVLTRGKQQNTEECIRRKNMECASRSMRRGENLSTLVVPATGESRKLAAKERAAANDKRENHHRVYAAMLAARAEAGPLLARARARRRMKLAASGLRAPTSESNDYFQGPALAWRACCKAAPAVRPAARRGDPLSLR